MIDAPTLAEIRRYSSYAIVDIGGKFNDRTDQYWTVNDASFARAERIS